ncbi:uncharacterized protein [Cardiocondyla obscurior]|uniref:uncharacterized protein n=1 Tax=Cardiocondyla obscurior TaxID=286306 RepID=UPI00396570EB
MTKTIKTSPSTSTSSNNSKNSCVLNLKTGVWDKVPNTILCTCERGEKLLPSQRQTINRVVADYMLNELKQTSRGMAEKIALNICNTYPKSFKDTIDNQQWGSGIESLRMQIYNCVQYMKHTRNKKRAFSSDSDDAELEERKKQTAISQRRDQYGCIAYAPKLPPTEDSKSQEEKRIQLLELFANVERDTKTVNHLMIDTYPTVRGIINEKSKKIEELLIDWPFLKDSDFLLQHSSTLLGKDVTNIWSNSLNTKVKPIRQYLKFLKKKSGNMTNIINECKAAVQITKNNTPKILVDTADTNVLSIPNSNYPVLIIRGTSLYDTNAICTVVFEKNTLIFCDDVSQGILICFLTYYVFGYCYPREIEKTLEFIQRVFLNINPITGGKKSIKSKRKGKSFDTDVFNLAKAALSLFPDL